MGAAANGKVPALWTNMSGLADVNINVAEPVSVINWSINDSITELYPAQHRMHMDYT